MGLILVGNFQSYLQQKKINELEKITGILFIWKCTISVEIIICKRLKVSKQALWTGSGINGLNVVKSVSEKNCMSKSNTIEAGL